MKKILFAFLAAVLMTACSKNNEDDTRIFNDFATLTAVSGQGCSLNLLKPDDGLSVTLTAAQSIQASSFTPGSRVFVSYSTPSNEPYVSGPCTLYALYNTEGGGASVTLASADETKDWESQEVNVSALTVTDTYINFVGMAAFTYNNYECKMYLDKATVDDEYPTLHLVVLNKGIAEDLYTIVGSWSIARLRGLNTCKGVTVKFNDPNHSNEYKISFK